VALTECESNTLSIHHSCVKFNVQQNHDEFWITDDKSLWGNVFLRAIAMNRVNRPQKRKYIDACSWMLGVKTSLLVGHAQIYPARATYMVWVMLNWAQAACFRLQKRWEGRERKQVKTSLALTTRNKVTKGWV